MLTALSTPLIASASTQLSFDFNSTSDLSTYFDGYSTGGTITNSASGGISGTGSMEIAPGDAYGVYTTKAGYSMGPVGSTYVFTAYMKSLGPNGYSGMGFTASPASAGSTGGNPFRPNDALGISVHGGGFKFHDGTTTVNGYWHSTLGEDAGIGTVTSFDTADQMLASGTGSASDWYKVVFTVVRATDTTMDTDVKVYFANTDGTLADPSPKAEYTFNDRPATDILGATKIYAYFNLSGNRVYNFDDFSVNLDGGVSVIEAGNPVVLTSDASESTGAISMNGDVTDDGGASVTDYGFAYSTTADPTTSDDHVSVGTGTGTYNGQTAVLANGTYHVRAYATNSNGTSYGSDVEVTIASGSSGSGGSGSGSGGSSDGSNNSNNSSTLAATGVPANVSGLGAVAVVLMTLGVAVRRFSRRYSRR
jgi:hypothetical protein